MSAGTHSRLFLPVHVSTYMAVVVCPPAQLPKVWHDASIRMIFGPCCLLQVGASTPEQAQRNAKIPVVPAKVLDQCSKVTERLRVVSGPEVDQHGFTSRIYGNGSVSGTANL